MPTKARILARTGQGFLEHIEWTGPPLEVRQEDTYLVLKGTRGSIVQVGNQQPGLFGLRNDGVGDDEIIILFEGSLLARVKVDAPWRPLLLPDREAMAAALDDALQRLLDADSSLLRADAAERNLTSALAAHLRTALPDWHVDCEHNRMVVPGSDKAAIKRISMWLASIEKYATDHDLRTTNIFPDIIVHRRESCCNLLVLEAKKDGVTNIDASRARDVQKLTAIKTQLGYRHAVLVVLKAGLNFGISEVTWLPDAKDSPGGPLCYVQYLDGDFLAFSSGGNEVPRVRKGS